MPELPTFTFLPLGAIIHEINVGGINIVHSFPRQEDYANNEHPHFGETMGRVANRISGAKLNDVNGRSYQLYPNEPPNTLHGGKITWGQRMWQGPISVEPRPILGIGGLKGHKSIEFTLSSPDGEEGFPGELAVRCIYTTGTQNIDGKEIHVLGFEYEVELISGAEETPINMTNHTYFNLTAGPTIEGTHVLMTSNLYLPRDEGNIPIYGPTPYPGIEADKEFILGPTKPDPDDCFILNDKPDTIPIDTRRLPLQHFFAAHHPESGIHLEVLSTEPAFQFYTGNWTNVPSINGATAKGPRSAFCVEPCRYVNAVNVPAWKHMVLLKKGQKYGAQNVYRVWKE